MASRGSKKSDLYQSFREMVLTHKFNSRFSVKEPEPLLDCREQSVADMKTPLGYGNRQLP